MDAIQSNFIADNGYERYGKRPSKVVAVLLAVGAIVLFFVNKTFAATVILIARLVHSVFMLYRDVSYSF